MPKILNRARTILENIENSNTPFIYYILTFFSVVVLRIFLETFSDKTAYTFGYFPFYASLTLAFILLFKFAAKESVPKVSRVVLSFFLVIILAPVMDLIFSAGKGYDMSYMLPGRHGDLLLRFFTLGGRFDGMGITPGMKIEIALILAGSFAYFFIKTNNLVRSLLFTFLEYTIVFIYSITPFMVKAINTMFVTGDISNKLMMRGVIRFDFLGALVLGAWLFYLSNKKRFFDTIKDISLPRLLHYELMLLFGIVLAQTITPGPVKMTLVLLFNVIIAMCAITFAIMASAATNNLADYDIDKISNKERPLVSGAIPIEQYKKLPGIFFLLAAIYSSIAGFTGLFSIVLFTANYYLYSMPPLRLKRVPFFSKLVVSLNSLVLLFLGYHFGGGDRTTMPLGIIAFFLVCLTASINFIDIKDYEGDKAVGIKTLPTILGLKKSKMLIGAFFVVSYIIAGIMLKNIPMLILALILGVFQYYFINRKEYNEKPVFAIYLSGIVLLMLYLLAASKAGISW